jgi:hypothetical protein
LGVPSWAIHYQGTPEACPYDMPYLGKFGGSQSGSLGTIIGQFKMRVTQAINTHRTARGLSPVRVWQRNYYERIVRDETELNDTRRYIIENSIHWATDENYR